MHNTATVSQQPVPKPMQASWLDLFRAEWLKVNGNRMTTGFFLWLFPLGALVLYILILGLVVLNILPLEQAGYNLDWRIQTLSAWEVTNNSIGRFFLLGFVATVFAGESSWDTWKNIIPRSGRTRLLLTKFLITAVMILIAFNLMALVMGVGSQVISVIGGQGITPAFEGALFAEWLRTYTLSMLLAIVAMSILAGVTAIAALYSRSIFLGALVGIGFSIVQQAVLALLLLLGNITGNVDIVNAFTLTPEYNLTNLNAFLLGNGQSYDVGGFITNPLSFEASFLILAAWFVGLLLLVIYAFNRRDVA